MNRRPIATLLALVALSVGGCGTVCNLAGGVMHPDTEPRIYGGVLRDFELVTQASDQPPRGASVANGKSAAFLWAAIVVVGVTDPILSFVADTLTLPITIPLQNQRIAAQNRERDASGPPAITSSEGAPRVEQLPDVRSGASPGLRSSQNDI